MHTLNFTDRSIIGYSVFFCFVFVFNLPCLFQFHFKPRFTEIFCKNSNIIKRKLLWFTSWGWNLLEDHLEGAVVEGVAAHHPHDLLLHHSLVRSPGEGCAKGLDAGQDPEGLCWRDSQRAIWTYRKSRERETRWNTGSYFFPYSRENVHIPSKVWPRGKKVKKRHSS